MHSDHRNDHTASAMQSTAVSSSQMHSAARRELMASQTVSRSATIPGLVALTALLFSIAGCGNTYRPVVTAINPVGPAAQPGKYAVVISSNGPSAPGLVTLVDVSGDTVLDTTALGVNPYYLMLNNGGSTGYTLNGDGTLNSFAVSPALRANDVLESTLLPGSSPTAIYDQGSSLYIATLGRNSVGQFASLGTGGPVGLKQELPTGARTVYTVGSATAPRAYALVQGAQGSATGSAAAIETDTNTISAQIPVGRRPVYGVMTADARRAFVLNQGSNTVSVINSESNALDTFTNAKHLVTSTIPVGVAPVWADFAPTLAELVVANQGDGVSPGSVSIISIPLCSSTTAVANPNCDPANPVDAVGFGTVIANVPVGINAIMVAVLQDGTRAYVANAGNAAAGIAGSVSVINLITNTVEATIPAGASVDANDNLIHGHPNFITATTGTPTGKIYITSLDSTDLTILRTDTDSVQTHLPLQGNGVMVRVSRP